MNKGACVNLAMSIIIATYCSPVYGMDLIYYYGLIGDPSNPMNSCDLADFTKRNPKGICRNINKGMKQLRGAICERRI